MQLHPAFITSLIADRERDLRTRSERRRQLARSERRVRSAPWPP